MIRRRAGAGWEPVLDVVPVGVDEPDPDPDPIPYEIPTSAPYNVTGYAVTPTPDGTGMAIHPGVVDFGGSPWNGHRYWMAMTPYPYTNDQEENPCILVSDDGYTWEVPAGLTNPIYPAPGGGRFNSDTDLEYDVENDRLVMIYRELLIDGTYQTLIATSDDGVTWPETATALNWTRPGPSANQQVASPAIIRRASGDWWLFGVNTVDNTIQYWRASDPTGAWTGPTSLGVPTLWDSWSLPWHLDVAWDGTAFRALLDIGPRYKGRPDGLRAGTIAADGSAMIWAASNILDPTMVEWDNLQMYRASMVPHENGAHWRVWYSGEGRYSWRTAYTEIPRDEWPDIGDTITPVTPPADPATPLTPEAPWNPPTLQQAFLDLGAEGYWKLDETTGPLALDYSGNDRHGVLAGREGVDYTLAGTDGLLTILTAQGMVEIRDAEPWRPTGGMTIFAVIQSGTLGGGYRPLIAKRPRYEQWGEWTLQTAYGKLAGGYIIPTGNGWKSYAESVDAVPSTGWHAVAMSKPAAAAPKFYIDNGTPQTAGASGTDASGATSAPVRIGDGYTGAIGHVAIIMRELTDSEVGTLMSLAQSEGLI